MQDNVSVLIATIVMVVIIVLFPIYNVATRQDSIASNMAIKATTNFVDKVRYQGYISEDEYKKYLEELDKTGNTYDVEMEVYKPVYIPTNVTDEYEEEYSIDYTNTVIEKLEAGTEPEGAESVIGKKVYYLNEGYKFYVRVKNTNVTQAQVLMNNLFGASTEERIVVNYGGKVYQNEWAKSETAQTANANISITRPYNHQGEEFKYETISSIFNPYAWETVNIYGIAVRLENPVNNVIKFKLRYQDVMLKQGDADFNGNPARKHEREEHVKSYIETFGFSSANILVDEQGEPAGANGLYSYEYIITFASITRDDEEAPFSVSQVQIKSGSAYSIAGSIGLLRTEEFVIFYENINLDDYVDITFEEKTQLKYVYMDYPRYGDGSGQLAPHGYNPSSWNNSNPFGLWKYMLEKEGKAGAPNYWSGVGSNSYSSVDYYYTIMKVQLDGIDNSKIQDIRWAKGEIGLGAFRNDVNFGYDIKGIYNSSGNYYTTSSVAPNMIFGNGKYTLYVKFTTDSGSVMDGIITAEYDTEIGKIDGKALEIYAEAYYDFARSKGTTIIGSSGNVIAGGDSPAQSKFEEANENGILKIMQNNTERANSSISDYHLISVSAWNIYRAKFLHGVSHGFSFINNQNIVALKWDIKHESYNNGDSHYYHNGSIYITMFLDGKLVYYRNISTASTDNGLNNDKGSYNIFNYDGQTKTIYLVDQFE